MTTQYHPNQHLINNNYGQTSSMCKNQISCYQNNQYNTKMNQYNKIQSEQGQLDLNVFKSNQAHNYYNQQHSMDSQDTLSSSNSIFANNIEYNRTKYEEVRSVSQSTQCAQFENEEEEMGVNYEDYTNISYQYPEYNDEEERIEEEENKKMIERFNQQETFVFTMENDEENKPKFTFLPVNKTINPVSECFLYGDIILESKYSPEYEKAINSFCNWKQIQEAQKRSNFVKVLAHNKNSSCENFNQVVQLLRAFQNKDIYLISGLLDNFGKIYNHIKQGMKQTSEFIQVFDKFQALQKRQQIFDQMSDEYLQNIPSDKIFLSVKNQPNFSTNQIESSHICFSSKLLELVNMDEDKFVNLMIRGKGPEFFGYQSRLLFVKHKIQKYLRMEDKQTYDEVDLLTRDGLRIPARARKELIQFDLDSKVPELSLNPFNETLIVYYFEIDQNTLNQIQHMRQNYSIEELNNPEEVDFYTYSLETQAFLDLYYSNINPQLQQQKLDKKRSSKKELK